MRGVDDLRGDDLETAWAAEENHVGGEVRRSVHQWHRRAEVAHLLPGVGGSAAVVTAADRHTGRRAGRPEVHTRSTPQDGCRSRRARPPLQRQDRNAGKALIRRIGVILAVFGLLAACSTKGSDETTQAAPPPSRAAVTPIPAPAVAKEAD